jgi:DNA-binding NarL/FixJ family response regulator
MYAKALKLRLEREYNCHVSKIYHDGISFLNDLYEIQADFIVIDYSLPLKNGCEIFQSMNAAGIHIPVIFITAYKFPEYLEVIGANGAFAYVAKTEIDTICNIISGNNFSLKAYNELSQTEYEFLLAIVTHAYNKDLAHQFNISVEAVKKRKSKLSHKLGLKNDRQTFQIYAQQKGLLKY